MKTRPPIDVYFMNIAIIVGTRATCIRREVGCVLVNSRKHILSTGYNGPAVGLANCIDFPCPGATASSGEALHLCQAVHAEANALLQCNDVHEINTAYSTVSPCIHCLKLLMNTSCKRIVFLEEYPHSDSERLWKSVGREWVKLDTVSNS